jgi:hypothetical protein
MTGFHADSSILRKVHPLHLELLRFFAQDFRSSNLSSLST